MPILALFFGGLMSGLTAFLATFLTRKLAIVVAAGIALATITTALLVGFNALVSPLIGELFNTPYGQFLGLAFPPVAGNCMAALGTTWTACTLYSWQMKALTIAVQA